MPMPSLRTVQALPSVCGRALIHTRVYVYVYGVLWFRLVCICICMKCSGSDLCVHVRVCVSIWMPGLRQAVEGHGAVVIPFSESYEIVSSLAGKENAVQGAALSHPYTAAWVVSYSLLV